MPAFGVFLMHSSDARKRKESTAQLSAPLVKPAQVWFAMITFVFGLLMLCTAFIHTWREIALRVRLGIAMSGIYPGLTYLIRAWYPRREQQFRFAFPSLYYRLGICTEIIHRNVFL